MKLNQFLRDQLGVNFENKYNDLAVQEILSNKEKYPHIAPAVVDWVNKEKRGKDDVFPSGFFDSEDEGENADYEATMDLYRAFATSFAEEGNTSALKVNYVTVGLDYLDQPNIHHILRPTRHSLGRIYVRIFPERTEIGQESNYPNVPGRVSLGIASRSRMSRTFVSDNKDVLIKAAEGGRLLFDEGIWQLNRFDSEDLSTHSVTLESGETGYPYDSYEISIGHNLIRLFSTERGFDAFSVLRIPVFESLTDELRKTDIFHRIETYDFYEPKL